MTTDGTDTNDTTTSPAPTVTEASPTATANLTNNENQTIATESPQESTTNVASNA